MRCPYCGNVNEAQSNMTSDAPPHPGAAALCFYCVEYGVFDTDGDRLYIRKPTATEKAQLSLDQDAQRLRREVLGFKRAKMN